jgi:hypothetical protein
MYWYTYKEPYIPHNTIVEKMVVLTSSSSNVHRVIDNNSNPYRNMVMDVMRMNQGHADQRPIIDEEPIVDVAKFFLSFERF